MVGGHFSCIFGDRCIGAALSCHPSTYAEGSLCNGFDSYRGTIVTVRMKTYLLNTELEFILDETCL